MPIFSVNFEDQTRNVAHATSVRKEIPSLSLYSYHNNQTTFKIPHVVVKSGILANIQVIPFVIGNYESIFT